MQPNRRSIRVLFCLTIVVVVVALPIANVLAAEPDVTFGSFPDWPLWRGPLQNNTAPYSGLPDKWNPRGGAGSNVLWKSDKLAGRSTPVVFDGKLYTIVRNKPSTAEEGEKVVCADAATGEILWEHPFNVYLSDVPDTRVGWSSCVVDPETGRVYAQGVAGSFYCLEGDSGDVVWEKSLHEEFGFLSTYGGRTNFPIVFEDLAITSAVVIGWGDTPDWGLLAKPAHRFLAFEKATGELRWLKGTRLIPDDTTYSTPTIAVINGIAQMVFASGDGAIWGLQPRTGEPVWKYQLSRRGVNVSPLVVGSKVFASHSQENPTGLAMGSVVALDAADLIEQSGGVPQPKVLWRNVEIEAGTSSPIPVGDQIWLVNQYAKLYAFDQQSGEQVIRKALGTMQHGTPLYVDGKVYTVTADGRSYVLEPQGDKIGTLHRGRLARGEGAAASPIIANGKIYITTFSNMYCIAASETDPGAASGTQTAVAVNEGAEPDVDASAAPAVIQVVPYDAMLKPGQTQRYHVRLYNQIGQFLRKAASDEVTFNVDGQGAMSADGTYTAPGGDKHIAARIVASVGDKQGMARVRIVPPLPWNWDLDDLEDVPLTWVGGRVRYVLREGDGGKYMAKRDLIPTRPGQEPTKLGTRSQLWMGPTDLANYTIQADVQLTEKEGKLPDVGLINSRYTMALGGEHQEVRVYSWATHDKRHQAAQTFPVQPGEWYTLKLRVEPIGDQATVLGKVWPRGESEPEEWTLGMTDTAPNLQGSPGLYGDTKNTELYLDNISVTPN